MRRPARSSRDVAGEGVRGPCARVVAGPPDGASGAAAYSDVVPSADPTTTAPQTAGFLRRLGAVFVDWLICQGIAILFLGTEGGGGAAAAFLPLGIFAALNVLFVSFTGSTVGHRLFGMQVWQVRPGSFPRQVVVRTVLLCLFVPAVLTASDGRGLHDVVAGTRLVRL